MEPFDHPENKPKLVMPPMSNRVVLPSYHSFRESGDFQTLREIPIRSMSTSPEGLQHMEVAPR